MPASVSNKTLLGCFVALFMWLLPILADADEFAVAVKRAELNAQGDSYVLSADIDYQLSPRAKEALQNGVSLFWVVQIKVWQQRDYVWDKMLVHKEVRYRIQYHALLNMYRVRNESSGEVDNFSTLPAALDLMSRVRDIQVIDRVDLLAGERYLAGVKVSFDRDALPLPLRPAAYVNLQWYLSSDWYVWSLKN